MPPSINWKPFLLVAIAIPAFGLLANMQNHVKPQNASVPSSNLQVVASSQDADGVREDQINLDLAKAIENHIVSGISAKLQMGSDGSRAAPAPSIESESVITEINGRRLILVRMIINKNSRAVAVLGISGNKMDRVFCVRESLEDISVLAGECGEKISAVFFKA